MRIPALSQVLRGIIIYILEIIKCIFLHFPKEIIWAWKIHIKRNLLVIPYWMNVITSIQYGLSTLNEWMDVESPHWLDVITFIQYGITSGCRLIWMFHTHSIISFWECGQMSGWIASEHPLNIQWMAGANRIFLINHFSTYNSHILWRFVAYISFQPSAVSLLLLGFWRAFVCSSTIHAFTFSIRFVRESPGNNNWRSFSHWLIVWAALSILLHNHDAEINKNKHIMYSDDLTCWHS